jgi:hypothetical protein
MVLLIFSFHLVQEIAHFFKRMVLVTKTLLLYSACISIDILRFFHVKRVYLLDLNFRLLRLLGSYHATTGWLMRSEDRLLLVDDLDLMGCLRHASYKCLRHELKSKKVVMVHQTREAACDHKSQHLIVGFLARSYLVD